MHIEAIVHHKIVSVIQQIKELLESDFPSDSPKKALNTLLTFFDSYHGTLSRALQSNNERILLAAATTINQRIYQYLPVIGFLQRSTDVINSFEYFYSLREITKTYVGANADIVISSEWDYSPLTYGLSVGALPNCVLMGLPVSESSNVLIIPLVGHELGHTVWHQEKIAIKMQPDIQKMVEIEIFNRSNEFKIAFPHHKDLNITKAEISQNLFIVTIIADIMMLCMRQVEEIFCDAFGAELFGIGFLKAFRYLLAPNLGGARTFDYPTLINRAKFLRDYSKNEKSTFMLNYVSSFAEIPTNLTAVDKFLSETADTVAIHFASKLYEESHNIASKDVTHLPNNANARLIKTHFDKGVPPNNPMRLSDIINAAWEFADEKFEVFDVKDQKRHEFNWISQVAFKAIEILEYNQRTSNNA